MIVILPGRKICVGVRSFIPDAIREHEIIPSLVSRICLLFYIVHCLEIGRITANIDSVGILINTNPIHFHYSGERQVVKIDVSESVGHA